MGVTVRIDRKGADGSHALAHNPFDRGTDLASHQRQRLIVGNSPLVKDCLVGSP